MRLEAMGVMQFLKRVRHQSPQLFNHRHRQHRREVYGIPCWREQRNQADSAEAMVPAGFGRSRYRSVEKGDAKEHVADLHTTYLPTDQLRHLWALHQLCVSASRYKMQAILAQGHHDELAVHYQHLQSMCIKHFVLQNSGTMYGMMSVLVHHVSYVMLQLMFGHALSHYAAASLSLR